MYEKNHEIDKWDNTGNFLQAFRTNTTLLTS